MKKHGHDNLSQWLQSLKKEGFHPVAFEITIPDEDGSTTVITSQISRESKNSQPSKPHINITRTPAQSNDNTDVPGDS